MDDELTLIGDELYFHGWRVARLVGSSPPSVQADFKEWLRRAPALDEEVDPWSS